MITLGYQSGHDGSRSVAVNVAFFVEEILDQLAVGNDERGIREPLEAEDTTEFSRPLRQSGVCNFQPPSLELRDSEKEKEGIEKE